MSVRRLVRNAAFLVVPPKHRWKVKPFLETLLRMRRATPAVNGKYFCVCCQRSFDLFLDTPHVQNFICPACGSSSRHRVIRRLIEQRRWLDSPGAKFLHFAAEWCLYKALSKAYPRAHYMTIDYAPWHGERQEDARKLTFEDGSYDLILCSHVLEHIEEDGQAMREMFRVLRPGGVALIVVPIYPLDRAETEEDFSIQDEAGRLAVFGAIDHVRNYGLDIEGRIRSAGFDVEHLNVGDVVPLADWDRERLYEEHFFVSTKPG